MMDIVFSSAVAIMNPPMKQDHGISDRSATRRAGTPDSGNNAKASNEVTGIIASNIRR